MTFRSFVRHVAAEQHRMERAARVAHNRRERQANRYHKELLREQKENARAEAKEKTRLEYEMHRSEIELLLSLHKECAEPWNWVEVAQRPEPSVPTRRGQCEALAQEELEHYRPGFFANFFGTAPKRRAGLGAAIVAARGNDTRLHEEALQKYQRERAQWGWLNNLARGLNAGDLTAFESALEHLDPFEELDERGVTIEVGTESPRYVEATARVSDRGVVPTEEKKLLASGKLSVKPMLASKRLEIYQDYVCSCAIRVGRELLALLPTELAVVHIETEVLNAATGHLEQSVVLSVAFSREGLRRLEFDTLDPSSAMTNFVHEMHFKKSVGFGVVRKLVPAGFLAPSKAGLEAFSVDH